MQKETAIELNATTTVVVDSAFLIEAMELSLSFNRQQAYHNSPPIDKNNITLVEHRLKKRLEYDTKVIKAEKIIDMIKSANRYGGFKIRVE